MLLLQKECSYSAVNQWLTGSALRKTAILLLFFSLSSFVSQAQNAGTSATDLQSLLSERASRVEQSLSTKDIDLQLFDLGAPRPAAIISYQTLENGMIRMVFPIYLPVNQERSDRFTQRLTGAYPFLTSMEFDFSAERVVCHFIAGTTENQMEEITNHFGYAGHETH